MSSPLLHPQDIIAFFVSSGGRTTNMQLVRHFGTYLASSGQHQEQNKALLKVCQQSLVHVYTLGSQVVTGHIATVRKQGGEEGGKVGNPN
jgi:hypothetical protein